MLLLGGQLITFNSIFKLAKLLCREKKKKRDMVDSIGRTKPKGVGKGESFVELKLHLSAGCFTPFLLGKKSRLYRDFKIHVLSSI